MKEHHVLSIKNRNDDEEDSEQEADEEHQSLNDHVLMSANTKGMSDSDTGMLKTNNGNDLVLLSFC